MMMPNNDEFFIVGSVLSGTTLLRNILRTHPRLICPEETHIFRWGDPFATETFNNLYNHADTLKLHRKIDGITDEKFTQILNDSKDRKALMQNYFAAFKEVKNNSDARCFDKSPQNIYGMMLIKAYFPMAKFVHIIRNPLNVIASILKGHPGLSGNILGAINYWKEAILIVKTAQFFFAKDIYTLKYEDFCHNPHRETTQLLNYLGEEDLIDESVFKEVYPAQDSYLESLSNDDVRLVKSELSELMSLFSY